MIGAFFLLLQVYMTFNNIQGLFEKGFSSSSAKNKIESSSWMTILEVKATFWLVPKHWRPSLQNFWTKKLIKTEAESQQSLNKFSKSLSSLFIISGVYTIQGRQEYTPPKT